MISLSYAAKGHVNILTAKKIETNCIDICIMTVKWSKKVLNKAPRPCILPLRCRIQEEKQRATVI